MGDIMESLKSIYKIGHGPSSSHTMGPQIASEIFKNKNSSADSFRVTLYGSLALTGKGHLTDQVIKYVLGSNTEIIFNYEDELKHPNTVKFEAILNKEVIDSWTVYSIGGGEIKDDTNLDVPNIDIYQENSMKEIIDYCLNHHISLVEYVDQYEDINDYLSVVLDTMEDTIQRGLNQEGILPGGLNVKRRARDLYNAYLASQDIDALVYSIALAVSEENASGGLVVTAPTCGSCGVIPAVISFFKKTKNVSRQEIINALKVGGIIGLLIRHNASISGAVVGCQGEIGAACSMAAAISTYLLGGDINKIEYSAEIALEHYLGLTCDPVKGLVQIPCIERNAISSIKAIASSKYAMLSDGIHKVSLDEVIKTMKETGLDLSSKYKETAIGGLAKNKQ